MWELEGVDFLKVEEQSSLKKELFVEEDLDSEEGEETKTRWSPVTVHRKDEQLSLSNGSFSKLSFNTLANISPVSLKTISLPYNKLVEIDLSGLSLCPELTSLCMSGNQLKSVSLEPLARCSKLEKLWLQNNRITQIDLSPLGECASFRSLYLDDNRIDGASIVLEPLRKCRLLKSLRLNGNSLKGELDITPLLECKTLTVFTCSGSVEIYATYTTTDVQQYLPPALRKRSICVNWREAKRTWGRSEHWIPRLGMAQRKETRFRVALVGFRKRHADAAEALLDYDSELEVFRIVSVEGEGLEEARKADIVLARANAEGAVRILHRVFPRLPIAVVGPTSDAENAGSCLRHGATIFLREPLCGGSVLIVRDLAENARKPNPQTPPRPRASTVEPPEKLLTENGKEVDFVKIRTRYYNRKLNLLGRCHLEESALLMLFSRLGGYAGEEDFASIATLCGLPISSRKAFFRAVRCWKELESAVSTPDTNVHGKGKLDGRTPEGGDRNDAAMVSMMEFAAFWRDNIRNVQAEARLFNVLRRKGESRVRVTALHIVVAELLASAGMSMMMVELATAVLSYAVNGKADGYTLSEAKSAKICASLLGAESNMHTGVTVGLREESLASYFKEFCTAGQIGRSLTMDSVLGSTIKISDRIDLAALLRYYEVRRQSVLTPSAVRATFVAYCGDVHAKMNIAEFVRMHLATMDPSSASAVNYFFKVMDADLDGSLTPGDLAPLYWEKGRAGFGTFWTCAKDMTRRREGEGISARDLRLLPTTDRSAFLRTILFVAEDECMVSLTEAIEQDPSGKVRGG